MSSTVDCSILRADGMTEAARHARLYTAKRESSIVHEVWLACHEAMPQLRESQDPNWSLDSKQSGAEQKIQLTLGSAMI